MHFLVILLDILLSFPFCFEVFFWSFLKDEYIGDIFSYLRMPFLKKKIWDCLFSPLFMNKILLCLQDFELIIIFFQHLKNISLYFLVSIVSDEKSILTVFSPTGKVFFLPVCFQDFESLTLVMFVLVWISLRLLYLEFIQLPESVNVCLLLNLEYFHLFSPLFTKLQ